MPGVLKGICRRFLQYKGFEGPLDLRLTGLGSLAVADCGDVLGEQVRGGCGFRFASSQQVTSGNAITTTAQWVFYNPITSPVTAYFDAVGMLQTTNTSNSNGATLYASPVSAAQCGDQRAASQTGNVTKNANPVSSRSPFVIAVRSVALARFAVGEWLPIAFERALPNTSVSGSALNLLVARDLAGSYCVPAGCGLALFLKEPSGNSFSAYAEWYEKISDWE